MFLTCTRVREAVDVPWTEIDLRARLWKLPAGRTKGARDRPVPLSDQAAALLEAQATIAGRGRRSGRVFPAVHLKGPDLEPIRAAVGGEPWQPRDIRRSAATALARLGTDPFVVSLVLGHRQADPRTPVVTGVYLRHQYGELVAKALQRLGSWVENIAARPEEPGDVLEFRK